MLISFLYYYFFLLHMPRASWHYYFSIGWQFIKLSLISNQLSFSFHSIIIIFYKLTNVWSFHSYAYVFCIYEENESGDIWDIKSISFIITINSFINNDSNNIEIFTKCKDMHADAIANFLDLHIGKSSRGVTALL